MQVEELRIYKAGKVWYVQNISFCNGSIEFRASSKSACIDYINDASRCRLIKCIDKDIK